MQKNLRSNKKGFTLIELLIVIAIIGFIAAAILVAVDPVQRIQDSRDTQRWSETNGILNAILKWQVDNVQAYTGLAATTHTYTLELTTCAAADTFGVTVSGNVVTPVVFSTDCPTTAGLLQAAIDGDGTVGPLTTTSLNGSTITIASATPGVSITTTAQFTGTGAGTLTETIANVAGASINGVQTDLQVIVADTTGIDCTTATTAVLCPDGLTQISGSQVNTGSTFSCVANLSNLVPDYLAEVPIDPIGDGNYPEGQSASTMLAIGDTNSGYYVTKTGSGSNPRITVGSCWGEQDSAIVSSR